MSMRQGLDALAYIPYDLPPMQRCNHGRVYVLHSAFPGLSSVQCSGTAVLAVAMSVFSTVTPILMMAEALRRIGASKVAMISASGPIATVIAGNLGLDERMTLLQSLGAALVVSGVVIVTAQPRATSTSKV
jgi:drug/metabolite transporter (DMT)-like permease